MRKGLIKKLTIILLALTMFVSPFLYPFNIKAYENDIWVISAYKYFENHGLNITMQYQNVLNLNLPNFTFTQYYGVPNSDYKYEVYRQGNNGYLGDYISSSTGQIYYKVNGETGVRSCNDCYILLNNTANVGISTSNTTINSGTSPNSYITEKEELFQYARGVYNTVSSYDDTRNSRFNVDENERLHLIFALVKPNDTIVSSNINVNLILNPGDINAGAQLSYKATRITFGSVFVYDIEIWSPNNKSCWFDLEIPTMNNMRFYNLIPMFFGYPKYMSTELYTQLYGNPFINTTESSDSVDNADNINNELTNSDNEYSTLENQFSSNLNTNLDNIDNSLNLNNNTSFIASANYVKDRFNWMTNNMPAINLLITFSLLVGLTTLLIGKVFK